MDEDGAEIKAAPEVSGEARAEWIVRAARQLPRTLGFLADHGGTGRSPEAFVRDFVAALGADGLDLVRVQFALSDFRPDTIARTVTWTQAGVEERDRPFTDERTVFYRASPVRDIHEGAAAVRLRIADGEGAQYSVTPELRAMGITDYLGCALVFADGSRQFVSFATARPDGFSGDDLGAIDALLPMLTLRVELALARQFMRQVLVTYLGRGAANRVLGGTIRRVIGEQIEAVVFACDLRGFTHLADTLPPAQVIGALSVFYGAVADAVHRAGGDIVKMIGDGVLALFPIEGRDPAATAEIATRAARAALAASDVLANAAQSSLPDGVDRLRAGFGLHVGPVTFGNVGSIDRLDFTVIGLAVNTAFRVEALTKSLGYPVLATDNFMRLAPRVGLRTLGMHALRGILEAEEIFAVTEAGKP